MRFTTGYENRRARIEIVPLIDVVFLLLVFFIYAMLSMTVYRGVRVSLPSGVGMTEDLKIVVINVSADNSISIDGRGLSLVDAVAEAARLAGDSEKPVLVSGDRFADLGTAVELLSNLRDANVRSVSFQVKREP